MPDSETKLNERKYPMSDTNQKVLAIGQWHSRRDCLKSHKPMPSGLGPHRMKDISVRASVRAGEWLVTSQCQNCGGLIVDCPTIGLAAFTL